ncbi:MAG: DNA-binding NtrC family response regulator [Myxococcota bacterium]|jgi:DNA-binding NtrC family response regulator
MPRSEAQPCILVIDDEVAIRRSMQRLLEQAGYQVVLAEDGLMALQLLEQTPINIALVDRNLPDILGEALIPRLLETSPTTLCIGMTGQSTAQTGRKMLEAGAEDYFVKPITDRAFFFDRLTHHLQQQDSDLTTQRRVRARLLEQHRKEIKLQTLKGNSPAMLELVEEIRTLAPLPVPVLIRGESGTGKELVAHAIHDLSPSRAGPFVPVNCAAIPHDLFESELFGHVKGSFTGALKDRAGLCGEAAGGTLFLDEVGELPWTLQAKLLRVLEQRTFRQVGSDQTQPLQARVVAATNVNLEQAIVDKDFRQDLYFRLSAQEIHVPPLRERSADIHQLAFHFIAHYNTAFGRQIQRIHPDALRRLKGWSWESNNVRELDREIQRALARCSPSDEELRSDMLFRRRAKRTPAEDAAEPDDGMRVGLLEHPLSEALRIGRDRITRWYLAHYLREARGNKTLAAKLAHGMQRTYFSRRCSELDVEEES